ncbi:hypothetical protein RB195_010721 [Necator americanus]|uniref:RING-type domain-containing protein n=1 Tax=Necator americanus TaxID=51031 RepID=A0ABR1D1H6_NECAM
MDFSSIRCPICLDIMVQAFALKCGHSFCEVCLDEAVNFDDRCPECRNPTQGICIPNLRLNDCIYTIVKRSNETLHVYNERRAQNEVQILKRRQARVLLFSVLHMAEKPLTSEEIEEEWKRMRGCNSLPAGLTNEMLRMVNSNKRCFEVVRHGDEIRVSLRKSPSGELH